MLKTIRRHFRWPSVLVGAFLLAACGETAPTGGAQGPMPVPVAPPISKAVTEWDEYTGRFEAIESVEVRARVSGYLDSIHFEDGQIVEKGDLLFVIDQRPLQAALDQALAGLESAKAGQELADMELRRGQRLLKSRTISQENYDQRVQTKRAADAAVAGAEANVRQAELDFQFSEVKAPVSGRVSRHFVSVGNLISGGTENSTLLTRIVSLDPIHFIFDADQAAHLKYLRLARAGERASSRETRNPVFLKLVDEDEYTHEGYMNFVDNRIDPNTGTIRGRALFENDELLFTPGMFGRLRLTGSGEYEAILIPEDIVLADQSRRFVWVVNAENVIEYRQVKLGPLIDGLRVVREGLSAEDRVVIGSLQRIRDGMAVEPTEKNTLRVSG
jgi:RND family efflux transporter MFP subunit